MLLYECVVDSLTYIPIFNGVDYDHEHAHYLQRLIRQRVEFLMMYLFLLFVYVCVIQRQFYYIGDAFLALLVFAEALVTLTHTLCQCVFMQRRVRDRCWMPIVLASRMIILCFSFFVAVIAALRIYTSLYYEHIDIFVPILYFIYCFITVMRFVACIRIPPTTPIDEERGDDSETLRRRVLTSSLVFECPPAQSRRRRRDTRRASCSNKTEQQRQNQGEDEAAFVCPICLFADCVGREDVVLQLAACGHRFHSMCLVEWMQRSDKCPVCRGTLL